MSKQRFIRGDLVHIAKDLGMMMTKKREPCSSCKGKGQTKQCRTEFHFIPRKCKNGKMGQQMVTDKLGSGCITCGGIGVQS